MEDFLVTAAHLRSAPSWTGRAGLCARGARRFCARYGIDWVDFVRDGVPASRLLATGDALAAALVEHARQCVMEVESG